MKKLIHRTIYSVGFIVLTLGAYYSLTSAIQKPEKEVVTVERTLFTPPPTPTELTLFREPMPLQHQDVFESFDREIFTNCYYHSSTIRILKLVPRFFPTITTILEEEGLPGDFLYLAVAESALDPSATSSAGAVGIWQFMKSTAPEYGLEVNNEVDERYHVEKATHAACRYFKKSYETFGDWTLVAAAFNAGNNGMMKQIERQHQTSYYNLLLNPETARYVFRIAALKVILEDPEKYGFHIPDEIQYQPWKTREVQIDGPIKSFPNWCAEQGITYKTLKILNPWLRQDYLTNKSGKTYTIKLPLEGERI
ncbi:MAG: lytic transglycosylase domain-containing protein [Mangrovibacterium sp.]